MTLPWGLICRLIPIAGLEARFGRGSSSGEHDHSRDAAGTDGASTDTIANNMIARIVMAKIRKRNLVPVLSGAEGWFTERGKHPRRVSPGLVGKLVGQKISTIVTTPEKQLRDDERSSLVAPLLSPSV